MLNLSRQEKIVFLVIIAVLLVTFGWRMYSRGRNTITFIPSSGENTTNTSVEKDAYNNEEICIIHIAGAVQKPGVYQLNKSKRIIDAVKVAGGETEKANLDAVNLAAPLYDGQKIIIPHIPENNEDGLISTAAQYEASQRYAYSSDSSLLNLNSATSHQLEGLPGIGPVLANHILEYQKNHGPFQHIEDVLNVPGIGEKKFASIKEFITVY